MICANPNSPEFKKLVEDLGGNEIGMKSAYFYWNQCHGNLKEIYDYVNNTKLDMTTNFDAYKLANAVNSNGKYKRLPFNEGNTWVNTYNNNRKDNPKALRMRLDTVMVGDGTIAYEIHLYPPLISPYEAPKPDKGKGGPGIQGSLFSINTKDAEVSKELEVKLISLLAKFGISISNLKDYKANLESRANLPTNMLGVADMINKVVAYDDTKHLPEEAAHMLFQLMIDQPFAQRLLQLVDSTELYKKNLELYGEAYNNDINRIKIETVGQLIAQELITRASEEVVPASIKSLILKFWNKIKSIFKNSATEIQNLTKDIATKILNEDLSVMNVENLEGAESLYSLNDIINENIIKDIEGTVLALDKRLNAAKRKLSKYENDKTQIAFEKLVKLKKELEEDIKSKDYDKAILLFYNNASKDANKVLKYFSKVRKGKTELTNHVLNDMRYFLEYYSPVVLGLANNLGKTGKDIIKNNKDRKEITRNLAILNDKFQKIESLYQDSVRAQSRSFLREQLANHPNLEAVYGEHVDKLVDWVKKDVWSVVRMFGAIPYINDVLLKSLHYKTVIAKQRVQDSMYDVGKDLLKVLNDANIEDFTPLFEKNDEGNNTGNILRQDLHGNFINYGQYEENREKAFSEYRIKNKIPDSESEDYFEFKKNNPKIIKDYKAFTSSWYKANLQTMGSADAKVFADNFKKTMSDAEYKKWFKANYNEVIYKNGVVEYRPTGVFSIPVASKYGYNPNLTAAQESVRQALLKVRKLSLTEIPSHRQTLRDSAEARLHQLPMISKNLYQSKDRKDVKNWLEDQFLARPDDSIYGERKVEKDGTQTKYIPLYYMKNLENLQNINTNLAASYMQFYKMAKNFSEMTEVMYDADVILNQNKNRRFEQTGKKVDGSELAKMLEAFVNMHILGERAEENTIKIAGKDVNIDKITDKLNSYVRLNNLVLNIPAIVASTVNAEAQKVIEGLVGVHVTTKSNHWADKEMIKNLPEILSNIGNVTQHNKVQSLLERIGVVTDAESMFEIIDGSKLKRIGLKNNAYSLWGAVDYMTKGTIALSVYNNTRLVNGKWINKNTFDKLQSELDWESLPTLYDAMSVDESGKLVSDVDRDTLLMINNKIKELGSRVDLQLTDAQKGAIYQAAVGRLFTTHRGWFIKGAAERFKELSADFNTGEIEEGYFRTTGRIAYRAMGSFWASPEKFQYLKEMWEKFDQLSPMEQLNLRRAGYEMAYATAVFVVALALTALKDDDDEEVYALELASYLANRTLLEATAFHNPVEVGGLVFNSPIAGARQLEDIFDIWGFFDGRIMQSGPYEGYQYNVKKLMGLTPGLKSIMGLQDPKSKNQFLSQKALKIFPGL